MAVISKGYRMEAAGIEPASEYGQTKATTCLVPRFILLMTAPGASSAIRSLVIVP